MRSSRVQLQVRKGGLRNDSLTPENLRLAEEMLLSRLTSKYRGEVEVSDALRFTALLKHC